MPQDTQETVQTGVPGLDQILRGGLPRNYLYLVHGPSGSGKTTLSLQFLLEGARRGETSLYIGNAESEADIRAVARCHGWDLAGVDIHHLGGPLAPTRGPEQTMLLPVEAQLPRVMSGIMNAVEQIKPARLVIDSLTEIRLLAQEDNWFRDQIKLLKQHFASQRCTVLLTDVFAEEQPVLRSAVHGVIELEQRPSVYGPDRRQLRVVKMRGVHHATGYHDLVIETGGLRVFPRLVAAEHRDNVALQTISSGLPELDELLGGGLDTGTATLYLGPTGTGKSSLVTQHLVAAARRGQKSAMYVFDERVDTLYQRAAGLGLELEEHAKAGTILVRQVDPVELTPGQFSQAVMDVVEDGAEMIAIDSLNGYGYAMPEERLLGLHLHELVSYLNQKGVTSLLIVTQHGLIAPYSSQFDLSYIADSVIVLRPFEFRGNVRKAIAVHKRRVGKHESTVREFDLSQGGVRVGEALAEFSGILSGQLEYFGDSLRGDEDAR